MNFQIRHFVFNAWKIIPLGHIKDLLLTHNSYFWIYFEIYSIFWYHAFSHAGNVYWIIDHRIFFNSQKLIFLQNNVMWSFHIKFSINSIYYRIHITLIWRRFGNIIFYSAFEISIRNRKSILRVYVHFKEGYKMRSV